MTLWFDVSDLCVWNEPQLTGIQRTVLSVLTELTRLRGDVRLFRCHAQGLSAIDPCELPWNWVEESGPLRTAAPVFERPWTQRAGRLVRSYAGENVAALLGRARDLSARLEPFPTRNAVSTFSGPHRAVPLFEADGACISLSATWSLPRYGRMIAGQRAFASIGCINLLYDLVPYLFPQWAGAYHTRRFTLWARGQIENADLILAISDFQKSEIERFIQANRLPSRPIATIRLGDTPALERGSPHSTPRYKPERPFVLCVSTIDVRKNQLLLYRVWHRLAAELGGSCPELLLVGMAHASGSGVLRAIRSDPSVDRLIVHRADVTDAELAWYYRNCLFTVYPSLYEGWGLPVAESLAAGRYCIASNAASLAEVGGDLIDYIDPRDSEASFKSIRRAIEQPEYVRQREREIRIGFRQQTWRATASRISQLADQTIERVKTQHR